MNKGRYFISTNPQMINVMMCDAEMTHYTLLTDRKHLFNKKTPFDENTRKLILGGDRWREVTEEEAFLEMV